MTYLVLYVGAQLAEDSGPTYDCSHPITAQPNSPESI